jgi:predicted RNA-binding protein YlxR (DUF448 family)
MKTKHVPIRTCLGCGRRILKGELIRIVMVDGALRVDTNGRLPGRGAYLCPETACISALVKKKGKLSYALRASVPRAAEDAFLMGLLHRRDGEESL